MKRILFNLTATQPVGNVKFHGGGKYGISVFKKLIEISPSSVAAYYNDKLYLDEEVSLILKKESIPTYKMSEIDILKAAELEGNIIYTPLYGKRLAEISPEVTVLTTIHGLRTLELPTDKYEKFYLDKGSVKNSILTRTKNAISSLPIVQRYKYNRNLQNERNKLKCKNLHFVTVSEHSKYSILSFVPFLKAQDIKVFYSPSTINSNLSITNYKNEYDKYYLIVSGNRWLKNGIRAIIAFDQLFSEHRYLQGKVVVTGLNKASDLAIPIINKDRFIFKGYVDETTLKGLYHYAYALVYPSLNEGFGYPPLEAMHEGCPVLASAVSSIPEICADAVIYFNPYLISEIKMRILQFEDENVRTTYIEKGKKRQQWIEKKQNEDLDGLCHHILSYVE